VLGWTGLLCAEEIARFWSTVIVNLLSDARGNVGGGGAKGAQLPPSYPQPQYPIYWGFHGWKIGFNLPGMTK